MKKITGTGVALVTPFNEDRSVDFNGLGKLVDYVINGGVEYLVLLGTTAESATLTKEEKKSVVSAIKEVNSGRVPMVLGIGGNNTEAVKQEFKDTDLSDFEAVLSVSPAYNKPTQEGIYRHYEALAKNTEANIILYNVPGRTSSNIAPETTLRLANDFKNIVGIKEASPNYLQSTEIMKDKPSDFLVISGDDEFALPMTLAGGSGVISVIGQGLPNIFSRMIRLGLERKVDESYENHYKIMYAIRAIFAEGNPAGIKALLKLKGICGEYTRLPLVPASQELTQKISRLIEGLD